MTADNSEETDEAAFEAAYAGANDEACITYPGENEGPLREAFRLGAALTAARRSRPTPDEMVAEVARLRAAITWALGEGDSDFGNNLPPARPRRAHYWWRAELSERAFGPQALSSEGPGPD